MATSQKCGKLDLEKPIEVTHNNRVETVDSKRVFRKKDLIICCIDVFIWSAKEEEKKVFKQN